MKILLSVSIILLAINLNAQVNLEWAKFYNGVGNDADWLNEMVVDDSGNVYVTGSSFASAIATPWNYATIKYDNSGIEQWVKTYNGPANSDDHALDIALDKFGNIYVTGNSKDAGGISEIATIKYSASTGEQLWVRRHQGSAAGIACDDDGNIYLTGWNNFDYQTIKYNTNGDVVWTKTYNGTGSDYARAIIIDNSGNIYVTGESGESNQIGAKDDIVTIKYNSTGDELWVQRYNSTLVANSDEYAVGLAVDTNGNVYIAGYSDGLGEYGYEDYITIKYSFAGVEEWVRRYNGPSDDEDFAEAIAVDRYGNVFVTGYSYNTGTLRDFLTIKYDTNGIEQWVKRYDGNNYFDSANEITVDGAGNIYVTGLSGSATGNYELTAIKYTPAGEIDWLERWEVVYDVRAISLDNEGNLFVSGAIPGANIQPNYFTIKYKNFIGTPAAYSKVIAGDSLTIKFGVPNWDGEVVISYVSNEGTQFETSNVIASNIPSGTTEYNWQVPDDLLSYRTKIIVSNSLFPLRYIESNIFRVKPYLHTKVTSDSLYQPYDFSIDRFAFLNSNTWPESHYSQFNYLGIDPNTGLQYDLYAANLSFPRTPPNVFPDWPSFARAFGFNAVYRDRSNGIYNNKALLKWSQWRNNTFKGACFGYVITNANYFMNRENFLNRFPDFPDSVFAASIITNNEIRNTLAELFIHQMGNPHKSYDLDNRNKTPIQTVYELIQMFSDDYTNPRGLIMRNNNGSGGHIVNPYSILRNGENWTINIYDNNFSTPRVVTVYPDSGNGNGSWTYPGLSGWGGTSKLYLKDPIPPYLFTTPTLSKIGEIESPFAVSDTLMVISNSYSSDIKIVDNLGRISGYQNGMISENIPNSFADIIDTGTETPPIGFILPADSYDLELSNFTTERPTVYFENGEMTYVYERVDATDLQTDLLSFDGSLSLKNTENVAKNSTLISLLSNPVEDKMFIVKSLNLTQNDSININYDSDKLNLTNYGTSKSYNIGLEYAALGRNEIFNHSSVQLASNSKHIISPDWSDIFVNELKIFVDIGIDGTIDDTIKIQNQFTDVKEHGSLKPDKFRLEQNYPNPFNPATTIKFSITQRSIVTLKVYDVLGNEVATLVNDYKQAGSYEIEFNASNLSSGVYFYKLQSGSFVETKKMILLK